MTSYKHQIEDFIKTLRDRAKAYYDRRLVSFVVFGSAARNTNTPESDIDILIILDYAPRGRVNRVREFIKNIEEPLAGEMKALHRQGLYIVISPVIKLKDEVEQGSPLFLDMVEDAILLIDKGDFFRNYLDRLRMKMNRLGSKKVVMGNAWYWILKPDYKYGDIIDL